MSPRARVAVAPEGVREWLQDAVRAGGGEVVGPEAAEALVWTAESDPQRLAEILSEYPGIRWVQLPWAGVEPYAEEGVLDRGRVWTSGKGVYARPVAEHALALALAGLRNLKRFASARRWQDQAGISLLGGQVTIFGGGGITVELLKLLAPLGCDVTVVRRHAHPLPGARTVLTFPARYEALRGADVVFLALALTSETTGLIGQIELELMEPHAWLVNVARGPHVATEDLVIALRGNIIGGAALDVTDPEPLPEGHPLWMLPNCLITPHTANTEDMAKPLLHQRIADNVRRFGAGESLIGLVDPELGY
ncbi:MAG TPA: D-isomer specific 2-hydroxyacid dehydrogenase family protein [Egibacteraceae bacterium]|nr:D-isomer specific 2-hydroxyacid dehydrogenase family protein [Actinomycetota bacterium]HWB72622.1 D-isomer specific 2-hydroxyacid dehydrogenase family protein [Egibacteraceae bacterium]